MAGLPALISCSYLAFMGFKSGCDERRHVDGLADAGSAAADEGAIGPTARLSRHRRKACETCRLSRFEGAEFGHFDEQGEGGYGRDPRNAGQNCEPLGEIWIVLNLLEDRRLDRRNLAFDLFEALRIVALQQRRGKHLAAVLGGGSVFHQDLASQVKLLELEQGFASRRACLKLQHCAHARQHRRIYPIGLGQLADRLGEAAALSPNARPPSVRSKHRPHKGGGCANALGST